MTTPDSAAMTSTDDDTVPDFLAEPLVIKATPASDDVGPGFGARLSRGMAGAAVGADTVWLSVGRVEQQVERGGAVSADVAHSLLLDPKTTVALYDALALLIAERSGSTVERDRLASARSDGYRAGRRVAGHGSTGYHYGGEAPAFATVEQVPLAEVEELASDLTPEQDARVSALHQAAAVSGRLIEALGSGHITFETEDVLAFARWVISGDATVEPMAIATAELAADQ